MEWAELVDRLRFVERKVSPLRIVAASSKTLNLARHLNLAMSGFRVAPGFADEATLSDGSRVDLRAV